MLNKYRLRALKCLGNPASNHGWDRPIPKCEGRSLQLEIYPGGYQGAIP